MHWKEEKKNVKKNVKYTRQNSHEKWLRRSTSCQIEKTNPNLETEKLPEVSHFDLKMNIGGQ